MHSLLLVLFIATGAAAQSWTRLNDFPGERRDDGVAVLHNNHLFAGSGLKDWWIPSADFYALNLSTYSWTRIADLPEGAARQYAAAFTGPDGFYVFGGDGGTVRKDLWKYNANNDQWQEMTAKPGSGLSAAVCMQFSNGIVIAGGKTGGSGPCSKEVWRYDQANDTWTQLNDFPFAPLWRASAAVINNTGYLLFGINDSGYYSNKMFSYDPVNDTWAQLQDFPGPGRAYASLRASSKKLVMFGGHESMNVYKNDTWFYDPLVSSWTQQASLPAKPRRGDMSGLAGDRLIITCGLTAGDERSKETWLLDVPLGLDPTGNPEISVYPNPVKETLRLTAVKGNGCLCRLQNTSGTVVIDTWLEAGDTTLSLASLPEGIYVLELKDQCGIILRKKIVKI